MTAQENKNAQENIITKEEVKTFPVIKPESSPREFTKDLLLTLPACLQKKQAQAYYEQLRLEDLSAIAGKQIKSLENGDTEDESVKNALIQAEKDKEIADAAISELRKSSINCTKKTKRQIALLYSLDYGKQFGKLNIFTDDEKIKYSSLIGSLTAKIREVIRTDAEVNGIKPDLEEIFSFLVNEPTEKLAYHANLEDCRNFRNAFIRMKRTGKKDIGQGNISFVPLTTTQCQQMIEYVLAAKIANKAMKAEYLEETAPKPEEKVPAKKKTTKKNDKQGE